MTSKFICLITSSFSKRDAYITLTSCLSKIILKINDPGNQKVISSDYQGTMPNPVLLNGSPITLPIQTNILLVALLIL